MRRLASLVVLAAGLSLLLPVAAAAQSPSRVKRAEPAKPGVHKRVARPGQPPRFKCETEDGSTECTCSGILDCKALIDSGRCGGKDMWEDGDDPSKGGCG